MTIDPAKFIVREKLYPQVAGYPEFCAAVVRELLDQAEQPVPLNAMVKYVTSRIKVEENATAMPGDFRDAYGELRPRGESVATLLIPNRYANNYIAFRQQYPLPRGVEQSRPTLTVNQGGSDGEYRITKIPLCVTGSPFESSAPSDCMVFPYLASPEIGKWGHDADKDELLWSVISQAYMRALDEAIAKPLREEEALRCYCLLSHDHTFTRRNATLSRIMLAYLEEKVGFDVPFTAKEIDLNVQAAFRTPDQFLEDYKNDIFFDRNDPEATSDLILQWHKEQARSQLAEIRRAAMPQIDEPFRIEP